MNQSTHIFPKTGPYSKLVQDAISLIQMNYGYLYGIEELAEELQVTKNHLIRQFTEFTGISPGKYLILVRITHAKSLLLSPTATPLELIAGACGYSCANYFSKAFKKETGMTPSQYAHSNDKETTPFSEFEIQKFYL